MIWFLREIWDFFYLLDKTNHTVGKLWSNYLQIRAKRMMEWVLGWFLTGQLRVISLRGPVLVDDLMIQMIFFIIFEDCISFESIITLLKYQEHLLFILFSYII